MTNLPAVEAFREAFGAAFGSPPDLIARAPGRVNLIGEHTDYNDGFVMPMAIDREVRVAVRRRADRLVRLVSVNYHAHSEFSLDEVAHDPDQTWSNYERGVVQILLDSGASLGGFDLAIVGDVPEGAGLSSSAAVEVATLTALNSLFGLGLAPFEVAKLGQRAEREFVGVSCGIMDQAISAVGRAGHAMLLDCRSLETTLVPLGSDLAVVVTDTAVTRGLVGSAYNDRRAECEEASAHFATVYPGVRALRDVNEAQFRAHAHELTDVVAKRARHVVTENARVINAGEAFRRGDLPEVGRLMYASHESLRDDFEVTVPELDLLVDLSRSKTGVFGARMTGAGFGGCIVALVKPDAVSSYVEQVATQYRTETGLTPRVFVCTATDGAGVIG